MVQVKNILIGFFLLVLSHFATAQTVGLSLNNVKATPKLPPQYSSVFLQKNVAKSVDNQTVSIKKPTLVPSVFSVEALPFFCKIEYKMGLNQKVPVKFRLGDVQYVDQLEGKH